MDILTNQEEHSPFLVTVANTISAGIDLFIYGISLLLTLGLSIEAFLLLKSAPIFSHP